MRNAAPHVPLAQSNTCMSNMRHLSHLSVSLFMPRFLWIDILFNLTEWSREIIADCPSSHSNTKTSRHFHTNYSTINKLGMLWKTLCMLHTQCLLHLRDLWDREVIVIIYTSHFVLSVFSVFFFIGVKDRKNNRKTTSISTFCVNKELILSISWSQHVIQSAMNTQPHLTDEQRHLVIARLWVGIR